MIEEYINQYKNKDYLLKYIENVIKESLLQFKDLNNNDFCFLLLNFEKIDKKYLILLNLNKKTKLFNSDLSLLNYLWIPLVSSKNKIYLCNMDVKDLESQNISDRNIYITEDLKNLEKIKFEKNKTKEIKEEEIKEVFQKKEKYVSDVFDELDELEDVFSLNSSFEKIKDEEDEGIDNESFIDKNIEDDTEEEYEDDYEDDYEEEYEDDKDMLENVIVKDPIYYELNSQEENDLKIYHLKDTRNAIFCHNINLDESKLILTKEYKERIEYKNKIFKSIYKITNVDTSEIYIEKILNKLLIKKIDKINKSKDDLFIYRTINVGEKNDKLIIKREIDYFKTKEIKE